jgi:hypothetical protein
MPELKWLFQLAAASLAVVALIDQGRKERVDLAHLT